MDVPCTCGEAKGVCLDCIEAHIDRLQQECDTWRTTALEYQKHIEKYWAKRERELTDALRLAGSSFQNLIQLDAFVSPAFSNYAVEQVAKIKSHLGSDKPL